MIEFARGADVLLVEATLNDASEDDVERGHLTAAEAIDLARDAEVGAALLVHYAAGSPSRSWIALCAAAGPWIAAGRPGAEPDGRARDRGRAAVAARSPARLARRRLQRRVGGGAEPGDLPGFRWPARPRSARRPAASFGAPTARAAVAASTSSGMAAAASPAAARWTASVSIETGADPLSSRSARRAWSRRRRDASIPAYAASWTSGWLKRHVPFRAAGTMSAASTSRSSDPGGIGSPEQVLQLGQAGTRCR